MKVCKATIKSPSHNGWIIFSSLSDALQSLSYDFSEDEQMQTGDVVKIKLETVEMTEEEFESLPEFEGF